MGCEQRHGIPSRLITAMKCREMFGFEPLGVKVFDMIHANFA
jgi:hypothetical protein